MHVVVVGCGRVGSGLARAVEASGHTVAIVDRQEKAFRRLPEGFAGRRVVGVGFDRDRLEQAGIGEAGALAAVTNGDNSNILVARIARETYGIPKVVARIYDPRRAAIYERLGIATIATVQWATERVLRRTAGSLLTVRADNSGDAVGRILDACAASKAHTAVDDVRRPAEPDAQSIEVRVRVRASAEETQRLIARLAAVDGVASVRSDKLVG